MLSFWEFVEPTMELWTVHKRWLKWHIVSSQWNYVEIETSKLTLRIPLLKGVILREEACKYSVGTSDVIHMLFSESNVEAIALFDIIVGA